MLKLNGKPLDLHPAPPIVHKIVAIVKGLPDDELLDLTELARKVGASPDRIRKADHESIVPHRLIIRIPQRLLVYGNTRTIVKLKKSMESA